MSTPTTGGRRAGRLRRRPVTPDVLLAVLLPLVCVAALLLVRPDSARTVPHPPASSDLTSASVVCPSAMPDPATGDQLGVTTLSGEARGRVQAGLGPDAGDVEVRSGGVASVRAGPGPVVVTGADDLAPGLVAGRAAGSPLAVTACQPTRAVQWFTAVGAGVPHTSVVELVNPNPGPAVADLLVWSPKGEVEAPALRGVTVPGQDSVRLDLGALVPRRGDLLVEARTLRGRLAVSVVDHYDELGGGVRASEWLPAQDAPATENLLLGLARGAGERTLVLGNPGADEVRAELKVVTPRSLFTPAGAEPVRVAPGTTQKVTLSALLEDAAAKGGIGLLVEATGPVTAALRQVVDDDLSLLAPAPQLASTAAVVLPSGRKRLLLAAPDAVGVATVTATSADGEEMLSERVDLVPDTGANIELPEPAVLITVAPERTSVRAAVLLVGEGTAAVPLREPLRTGLVPDVRPGLP